MLALFVLLVLALACVSMYAFFNTPHYRTIRRTHTPLPPTDQVSISVNVPVTGVVWTRNMPSTVIEEEIFVDGPDPVDLMLGAIEIDEIIDDGPVVFEQGYGYGADVVEVDDNDPGFDDSDVDFGSGDDF